MFIIARHASQKVWFNHYDVDPSESGLHICHSIGGTVGYETIERTYGFESHAKALEDCRLLNAKEPSGEYEVVRVLRSRD